MKIQNIACVLVLLAFAACSSSSGGGGGTITGVRITADLASLSNTSISKSIGKAVTKTATEVVVTNPISGGSTCKTAAITDNGDGTGTITVDIKDDEPALITIIDDTQTGEDMTMATIQIDDEGLDTIPPRDVEGEEVDFGTLTIEGTAATSDVNGAELVAELGNTEAQAQEIGSQDQIATRFSNPDMDSNGIVDCVESTTTPDSQGNKGTDFMLDFHIRFIMKLSGTAVKISDMFDNYLSSTLTTASYDMTGIYAQYLNTFSSATTGTITFEQQVTTSEAGVVAANTPIPAASVTTNAFGNYNGYGVNVTSASELPYGKILYAMGDKTLTFTDVQVPTLAELNAPTGRIFPFIKITKTNAACTTNCTIASLGYKWMKKTATGWEAASLADVTMLVKSTGATFSFRVGVDTDSTKYVTITLPKPTSDATIEGTITWTSSNASLTGVTAAEFDGLYTSQLCHIGLSYDDQLGMRYFETIANATGTCAG